jgi:hypothetical protein
MASNLTKWSAYGTTKTAINAAAEFKNIATTAGAITANGLDNTAGYPLADIELLFNTGSAVSSGGYAEFWFISSVDGTNYEDGSASVFPARPADVYVPLRAVSGSQTVTLKRVTLPQGLFKTVFRNSSGQTTTNTDSLTMLYYRPYTPDLITA